MGWNHQLPGNSAGDLFGMVKWPLHKGWKGDLQIGDIKGHDLVKTEPEMHDV